MIELFPGLKKLLSKIDRSKIAPPQPAVFFTTPKGKKQRGRALPHSYYPNSRLSEK